MNLQSRLSVLIVPLLVLILQAKVFILFPCKTVLTQALFNFIHLRHVLDSFEHSTFCCSFIPFIFHPHMYWTGRHDFKWTLYRQWGTHQPSWNQFHLSTVQGMLTIIGRWTHWISNSPLQDTNNRSKNAGPKENLASPTPLLCLSPIYTGPRCRLSLSQFLPTFHHCEHTVLVYILSQSPWPCSTDVFFL